MRRRIRTGAKGAVSLFLAALLSAEVFLSGSFTQTARATYKNFDLYWSKLEDDINANAGDPRPMSDFEQAPVPKKKSDAQIILGQLEPILIDPIKEAKENILSQFSPSAVAVFEMQGGDKLAMPEETLNAAVEYCDAMQNGTEQQVLDSWADKYGKKAITGGVKDLFAGAADTIVSGAQSVYESFKLDVDYMKKTINNVKEKVNKTSDDSAKSTLEYYAGVSSGTRQSAGVSSGKTQTSASSGKTQTTGSKPAGAKSVTSSKMSEVKAKAQTRTSTASAANGKKDGDRKTASGNLDPKWADVSNWIGMTVDELRQAEPGVDSLSSLRVYVDDNKRITEVDISDPSLNVLGLSPGVSYDTAIPALESSGWKPDGEFPGVPMPFWDMDLLKQKHYQSEKDEDGNDCVFGDVICYIKDGYVINLIFALPEGKEWDFGVSDYSHAVGIIYGTL